MADIEAIAADVRAIKKLLESQPKTKTGVVTSIEEGSPFHKLLIDGGAPGGYATQDVSLLVGVRPGQKVTVTFVETTKTKGDKVYVNRYIESVTPF